MFVLDLFVIVTIGFVCLDVWFKCCVSSCELWCWWLDLLWGVLLVLLFVL